MKLTRNTDKSKFALNSRGIAFDGKCFLIFDYDTARNVIIFGVDNSSWPHIDNRKNEFLVLGEVPTEGFNGSVGAAEKIVLTLAKQI